MDWNTGAGLWSNPANWGGSLPDGGDLTRIETTTADVTISSGVVGETWRMNIGRRAPGTGTSRLTIESGGTLRTGVPGSGQSSIAGINMNWSGSGDTGRGAEINVDGGTLITQTVRASGHTVAGQDSTINVLNNGTVTLSNLQFDEAGGLGIQTLSIDGSGSTVTASGDVLMNGGLAELELTNGGSLIVEGNRISYDDRLGTALVVGNGSTLTIGRSGNNAIDHGLTIATGATFGTGRNEATPDSALAADLTLQNGMTLDYSINGSVLQSDTIAMVLFSGAGDLALAPGDYTLLVDLVAGGISATDGDPDLAPGEWNIFTWGAGATGPTSAEFNLTTWNIDVTNNTRLGSAGTVLYEGDASGGRIFLSGFSAASIPEPSTTMLLGVGSMVMYLRRRIRS